MHRVPCVIFQRTFKNQCTLSSFIVVLDGGAAPAFGAQLRADHLHLGADISLAAVRRYEFIFDIDVGKSYLCPLVLSDHCHLLPCFLRQQRSQRGLYGVRNAHQDRQGRADQVALDLRNIAGSHLHPFRQFLGRDLFLHAGHLRAD